MNSSQDMFEDEGDPPSPHKSSETSIERSSSPSEVTLEEIKGSPLSDLTEVRNSRDHVVLAPIPGLKEEPKRDKWDSDHVRMPNSPQNLLPVSETELKKRWELIKESLQGSITSSKGLERAIFSYNSKYSQRWSFSALHSFFFKSLPGNEATYFFSCLLPKMVSLALSMESQLKQPLPLLKRHSTMSITLSQRQVAIILANAFLCTFPRRNAPNSSTLLPTINFTRLFQCGDLKTSQEKLKCFLNYFRRVLSKCGDGLITYTRHFMDPNKLPLWSESEKPLTKLCVMSKGTIEDEGLGMMEVDFANKFVGGGVLGRGCVQEEIKFLICPELVAARLFSEALDSTEALIIKGCERYNKYTGYGESFMWGGDYVDTCPKDKWGRIERTTVAIDAINFRSEPKKQFRSEMMARELNKAYVGFSGNGKGTGVASGNWGCGAFGGDPKLKALLQLMAASEADRALAYFTFNDETLAKDIKQLYNLLTSVNATVGSIWKALTAFTQSNPTGNSHSLYQHLLKVFSEKSLDKSLGEPKEAEMVKLKTEEGRQKCLETEKERWAAYETAKASMSPQPPPAPVKRKISDYFPHTDKT